MADSLLVDFPKGPLDNYRQRASFDWKKFKLYLETRETLETQSKIYKIMNARYTKPHFSSLDEERQLAIKIVQLYNNIEAPIETQKKWEFDNVGGSTVSAINPSGTIKYTIREMFLSLVENLGTQRHNKYIENARNGTIIVCFCLTEIGHGSNVRAMRTTATYDETTEEFVLNTPDFESAKCWVGNLGQGATHGAVFAQLLTANSNETNGLHAFIVPLRDVKTLTPYPGVTIADMGPKIALNGIDNGVLMFDNYRIPKENLLNRLGDVNDKGEYVASVKDVQKIYSTSFGVLSHGRINVGVLSTALGVKALTIAIRYAAIRRQFGPANDEEVPILEYQSLQYRLLPYVSAVVGFKIINRVLNDNFIKLRTKIAEDIDENTQEIADLGMEIHVITSSSKPIISWTVQRAIQQCREACGGHGYLKAAGLGELRNENDANITYEGENSVIIQQTSKWLIKLWPLIVRGEKISNPMQSANFLSDGLAILKRKFIATSFEDITQTEAILSTYQWLVCHLLRETWTKIDGQRKSAEGLSDFTITNNSQIFYAKELSLAFVSHFIMEQMWVFAQKSPDENIKAVLSKLLALYGLWNLEDKFITILYRGGYVSGPEFGSLLHNSILKLCSELKDDAVSLIDAITIPDFVVNSFLGASDGQVYKRMQNAIFQTSNCMSKPDWWPLIANQFAKSKI